MHILQTRIDSKEINSKKSHKSSILHISQKRPQIRHFLHLILNLIATI